MNKRIIRISLLSALLVVSKEVLSFLPNIELVSLLIILYTYSFGTKDTLYSTIIFVLIESILYPPHIWIITYLIVWPLLVVITNLCKKKKVSTLTLAIISGLFGLSFGFINSIVSLPVYGFSSFIPLWLLGLSWDLVHGLSNYFITLILFEPLYQVFIKLSK